jgi:hypothetical protein
VAGLSRSGRPGPLALSIFPMNEQEFVNIRIKVADTI